MGRYSGGKRSGGPWYGDDRLRPLFERGARRSIPGLRALTVHTGPKAGRLYTVTVDVPHYEDRRVAVHFAISTPRHPVVRVDGPPESPHRFSKDELCMWEPGDPDEQRWLFDDGLPALLGLTVTHLFREAWWRETGEWLGPEAPHGPLKTDSNA